MTEIDNPGPGGRIEPVELQVEMQRSYLDYAMSVIVGRALPDVRDGLKPVHRRVLYAMYDGGYRPDRGFSKCARVVGDVMGSTTRTATPRSTTPSCGSAQPWSLRYPLVDGQGNFGSPGNDPAAAMRYTECRMAPLAMEMVRDIDEDTVDFQPNYDGRTVSRSSCRRASRTCWSTAPPASRSAWRPTSRRTTCARSPPARSTTWSTPRSPARSCSRRSSGSSRAPTSRPARSSWATAASRTPTAPAAARSSCAPSSTSRRSATGRPGRHRAALPGQPRQPHRVDRRACTATGKLAGIADIRDETSDRTGMRLVIVLKRDAVAKVVLNNLYKHTQLQTSFGANMLALVDGVPRTLTLDQLISHYVDPPARCHRPTDHLPAAQGRGARPHPARPAQGARRARRGHRADPRVGDGRRRPPGLDRAARHRRDPGHRDPRHAAAPAGRPGAPEDHRRARRARGRDRRPQGHPRQARAPARDRQRGAGRDRRQVRRRASYRDPRRSTGRCRSRTSSPRRTSSSRSPAAATPSAPRSTSTAARSAAARACRAPRSSSDDIVEHFFTTTTHHWLLFFTNLGRVYRAKAYELPDAGRDAKGSYVANLLAFQPDEKIAQVLAIRNYEVAPYLVLATKQRPGQEDPPRRLRLPAHRPASSRSTCATTTS